MEHLVKKNEACRLCGSTHIDLAIALESIPILSPDVGELNVSDAGYSAPNDVYLCRDCGLMQMIDVVDTSFQYDKYLYRTGISLGLSEHFADLAQHIMQRYELGKGDLVVDVGSNDGTTLRHFKALGAEVQGVEPAKELAVEVTAAGVPTYGDFFTEKAAKDIVAERGKAKAIISLNAFANINDLSDVMAGIRALLDKDGVFVIETQYAPDVLHKFLLDVIYHEHLSYFAVKPVSKFFSQQGLELIHAERIWPKGGSVRFIAQLAGGPHKVSQSVKGLILDEEECGIYDLAPYEQFTRRVVETREQLHELLDKPGAEGDIAAFGSSVGCVALINQFKLGPRLKYILDDKPLKQRLVGLDYDLEVVHGSKTEELDPSQIIVLAWRYARPIASRRGEWLSRDHRFISPLPWVRVLDI